MAPVTDIHEIPDHVVYYRSKALRSIWQSQIITNQKIVIRNADVATWDHSPIVPFLAVVMLVITVFLLILFRQNPTLVACTVASCLLMVGMYLTLNNMQNVETLE